MRSLQDRILFITNIYQHSTCTLIESFLPLQKLKIYMCIWNSIEINLGGWREGGLNTQQLCLITTCNERRINRAHIAILYILTAKSSVRKIIQWSSCTNLHIYNVYVNIILWRNLNFKTLCIHVLYTTSLITNDDNTGNYE